MSLTIMLIAINALAGFALGLLGRSRIALFALFGSMIFSATVLMIAADTTVVWKTLGCMFTGQAAFLLASAFLFFLNSKTSSPAITSQEAVVKNANTWDRK